MSSAFNGFVPVRVRGTPTRARDRVLKLQKTHGFTLIELLIVVGIIAVLLSLLLPSLSRAREQARQIQCLNNLRQIGLGVRLYLQTSRDYPPAAAVVGTEMKEDWIYWQADRRSDPTVVTGAIPKAMGAHVSAAIFTCPSDEISTHVSSGQDYPFTYSANWQIFQPFGLPGFPFDRIATPARCLLIIDESSLTVDDGCWTVGHYNANHTANNILSNRHDRQTDNASDPNAGRGNVLYADFHAEFIPRSECLPQHPENWLAYPGQTIY